MTLRKGLGLIIYTGAFIVKKSLDTCIVCSEYFSSCEEINVFGISSPSLSLWWGLTFGFHVMQGIWLMPSSLLWVNLSLMALWRNSWRVCSATSYILSNIHNAECSWVWFYDWLCPFWRQSLVIGLQLTNQLLKLKQIRFYNKVLFEC